MATPNLVTVRGILETPAGEPNPGASITLHQKVWLSHADGTVIEPTRYVATADAAGVVTLQVPPTTDPDWSPQNWTYRVTLDGAIGFTSFQAGVPHDAPDDEVTIGSLVPIMASDGVIYATVNHVHSEYASTVVLNEAITELEELIAAKLSLVGGALSGALSVTGIFRIEGPVGTFRQFQYASGPLEEDTRWSIHVNNTGEGGANAGSNFRIVRYSDDGVALDAPMAIERNTGEVTFGASLVVGGNATVQGVLRVTPGAAMEFGADSNLYRAGVNKLGTDGAMDVSGNLHTYGALSSSGNVGFYGTAPVAKPTVTGSRGGNAALASLLTALQNQGLIINSTTA